ncbi:MAG TPA: hypothetical protein VGQ42_09245 [Candidatus Dormibacteraeota bacterium]|jgi:hypothetical protein|nr:hypothetical protein [Candidatus Dormibacteraeota bacterium]
MDETMATVLPSRQELAEQLHSSFDVELGDGSRVSLRLVELEDRRSTAEQEQFALVFGAPASMPPQQGVYRLEHQVLGAIDIFLVPIGRDGDALLLEAVFNRFSDVVKE